MREAVEQERDALLRWKEKCERAMADLESQGSGLEGRAKREIAKSVLRGKITVLADVIVGLNGMLQGDRDEDH